MCVPLHCPPSVSATPTKEGHQGGRCLRVLRNDCCWYGVAAKLTTAQALQLLDTANTLRNSAPSLHLSSASSAAAVRSTEIMEGPWQPSECNDMFKTSEASVEIGSISRLGQTPVSLSLCALSLLSRCLFSIPTPAGLPRIPCR